MILTKKVTNAQKFAITAHGEQKYGDEFPYSVHLQAVVSVLLRFDVIDEDLLCAAWLHDTLEDTDRTYEEIQLFFGDDVSRIVSALTEPKGGNRAWRHGQTYPVIARFSSAVIVKLADRIANIESGGTKAKMYLKEYPAFKQELQKYTDQFDDAEQYLIGLMWNHLDGLIMELLEQNRMPPMPRMSI